jgi:uncharacterized YigZ family protein
MDEKNNEKDIDIYYTIEKIQSAEIKIKGSKFIGTAAHTVDKESAQEFLALMRSQYFDATHNCYAYKIGYNGMEYRFSDDGEPNGTGGKPILFSLSKFDVSDLIVVVTRYYGGTKLGVGPLARAYSDAACAALELCNKVAVHRTIKVKINCIYEDINIVKRILNKYAVSSDENYLESVEIIADIHLSKAQIFCDEITKITNARVGARVLS